MVHKFNSFNLTVTNLIWANPKISQKCTFLVSYNVIRQSQGISEIFFQIFQVQWTQTVSRLIVIATLVQQIHFCRAFLIESRSEILVNRIRNEKKKSRNEIGLLLNISKIQNLTHWNLRTWILEGETHFLAKIISVALPLRLLKLMLWNKRRGSCCKLVRIKDFRHS